jgi:hypothetical protein
MSDDDRNGRRKRLWILLAIAATVVIAVVAVSIVGSRRVDSAAAAVRESAASATIDPSTIVFEGYDADDNSVADALGVDPTDVVLNQGPSNQWCVQVEISHLASSQSLYFNVDDSGDLSEVDSC